jgi:hypothetical protein
MMNVPPAGRALGGENSCPLQSTAPQIVAAAPLKMEAKKGSMVIAWGPMTVRKAVSMTRTSLVTSRSGSCQLAASVRRPPSWSARNEAWRT